MGYTMVFLKKMFLEFKIAYRNKINLLLFFFLTMYVFYLFYSFAINKSFFQPGSSLTFSSFYVQVSSLVFVIAGLNMTNYNLISSKQIITKIQFVILYLITINLVYYGIYALILVLSGITGKNIFMESFIYITIYWIITPLAMFFIGILISLVMPSNFKYLFGVIICLCLGPFGSLLFEIDAISQFNLGQRYNESFYHPIYGFFVEKYEISKRLIILFILMSITVLLIWINYKANTSKVKQYLYILSAILILSSNFYILIKYNDESLMEPHFQINNSLDKDFNYYSEIKTIKKEQSNIKPLKYKISFNTDKGYLDSKVAIKFRTDQNKITFNLYHGFNIEDLKLNGEPIEYLRQNDLVIIKSDKKLLDVNRLTIHYYGNPSPLYFSNSKAIYLPNIFSWIPSFNSNSPITIYNNEFLSNYSQNSIKTNYELTYTGKLGILTNLTQKNDENNSYICNGCKGITVVSGNNLEIIKVGEYTVYSPEMWANSQKLPQLISYLEKATRRLNKLLDINNEVPKKIFLTVSPVYSSLYEQNFWITDDHMILSFPIQIHIDENIKDNNMFMLQSITAALTWKKSNHVFIEEELDFIVLFDAYLGNYLLNSESDYYQFIIENLKKKYQNNKKVLNVINQIGLIQNDEKRQEEVLRHWYQLIKLDACNWENLILGG